MFTGLIEEIGSIKAISSGALVISAKAVLAQTKIGDSIAVNGVCLTVTALDAHAFHANVMPETLRRSSLAALRYGSPVNLERAMLASERFGGHIVTGHIDGVGILRKKEQDGNAIRYHIAAPPALLSEMLPKGSIAIDGISLTIISVEKDGFSVGVIPHTAAKTILEQKRLGDSVNLETDILAKYTHNVLQKQNNTLTAAFLAEHGFY